MWPLLIVLYQPSIEIGLQLVDRAIDLLAERDAVELVKQRAMEAFTDAVGLRALCLGPGVIDVLDGQGRNPINLLRRESLSDSVLARSTEDAEQLVLAER
jgi:hypothetical protein